MSEKDVDHLSLEQAAEAAGATIPTLKNWLKDVPDEYNPVVEGGKNGVKYKISARQLKEFLEWKKREAAKHAQAQSEHLNQMGLGLDAPAQDEWARDLVADWSESQKDAVFRVVCGELSLAEHKTLRTIWKEDDMAALRRGELLKVSEVHAGLTTLFTMLRQDILGLEAPIATRFNACREDRLWIRGSLRERLKRAALGAASVLKLDNREEFSEIVGEKDNEPSPERGAEIR